MTRERIHVLQLLQGLNIGGIEIMAGSVARGLNAREFKSSFCTFDWKGALAKGLQDDGYDIHFRKRRGPLDFLFVAWLAKLIRSQNVDIVQAHNATALLYGALATSLAGSTKFLYTEHDRSFPSSTKERVLHAVLAKRTDAVVTVSQLLKNQLVQYESFPDSRIHVLRNGIKLESPQVTRQEARRSLGLGDQPTVGIVARLAPVKNHELLLKSWKRVLSVIPDAVLLIIGDGSQGTRLKLLAKSLELGESVRFLGFRMDVSELLQALDIFVLCSKSEGLSLTLLESCARGIPIVATNVGGNPEVVEEGRNGLLVPTQDERALATALARLLQDETLRQSLATAGRALYDEKFTLTSMVHGYEEIYRQLSGGYKESNGAKSLVGEVMAGDRQ